MLKMDVYDVAVVRYGEQVRISYQVLRTSLLPTGVVVGGI